MGFTEHYDVVVIGRGRAGLVCATLLARRRLRVRLMFPVGKRPSTLPPCIFGHTRSAIVRRTLDELGLIHGLKTQLETLQPLTLSLGTRRGTLPVDTADRRAQLAAWWPEDTSAVHAILDRIEGYGQGLDPLLTGDVELPPESFNARRAWRKALGQQATGQLLDQPPQWTEHPELQRLLTTLLIVAGRPQDTGDGPITAGGARALWHLGHGIAQVAPAPETAPWARDGFDALLARKLESSGGAFNPEKRVSGLLVDKAGRRAEGVVTTEGAQYSADTVIFTDDDTTLSTLWRGAPLFAPSWIEAVHTGRREIDSAHPAGPLMAWSASDDSPLYLVHQRQDHLEIAGPPEATLDAAAIDPAIALDQEPPIYRPVAPRMGEAIDPLNLFAAPMRTGLRNLLRAGGWLLPGLGFEGVCLSAWQAAAWTERLSPRRRRLG
ncbi:MAG: hypothetical protein ACE366_25495 [Bradymonadia bacterium]